MTYSPKWQCRATGPDLKSQLTDPKGRGSKHSRNTDPWNPLITECQVSSDCFNAEEAGTMVPRETDSLACFPGSHEALLSQKFVTSKKARQSWSPGAEDHTLPRAPPAARGSGGGISTLYLSPIYSMASRHQHFLRKSQ